MRGGLAETWVMAELGTRCTYPERVHVGNSLPKTARAVFLPDGSGRQGHSPVGESPTVPVARIRHVAIPQFLGVTPGPLRGVNGPAALKLSFSGGCNRGV